jgi:hypothetical protein
VRSFGRNLASWRPSRVACPARYLLFLEVEHDPIGE